MDKDMDSWLENSDAMLLMQDTREYTLRHMDELEKAVFPHVENDPSAPLTALKRNLRSVVEQHYNFKARRIASNGFLLMAFSAFEYTLSQALLVFLGASARPGRELSFTESQCHLTKHKHRILSCEQWKLMQSVQEIRHAIAHRGSVIELADDKYDAALKAFAPVLSSPFFEENDSNRAGERSPAELAAIAQRPSYLTFKKADIEVFFDFSKFVLLQLVTPRPR